MHAKSGCNDNVAAWLTKDNRPLWGLFSRKNAVQCWKNGYICQKRLMFITTLSWPALYVKTVTDFSQLTELYYSLPPFVSTIVFMFCTWHEYWFQLENKIDILMFSPWKLNMNTLQICNNRTLCMTRMYYKLYKTKQNKVMYNGMHE